MGTGGNITSAFKGAGVATGPQIMNNSMIHLIVIGTNYGRTLYYINCTLAANISGGVGTDARGNPSYVKIGHDDFNTGVFNGTISNVRVWNGYELNNTEKCAIFNSDLNYTSSQGSPPTNTCTCPHTSILCSDNCILSDCNEQGNKITIVGTTGGLTIAGKLSNFDWFANHGCKVSCHQQGGCFG